MAARERWGDWCIGGGCGGRRIATTRRCISSNIDARRPAASSARSNAMAKEGHINYDVSDVLVEARGAPMTGSGWYGRQQQPPPQRCTRLGCWPFISR